MLNVTMQCFDSEFAFDLLDKSQAADCNRFLPPRVSHRQIAVKSCLYPLVMGSLKIRQFREAAQRN